MFPLQPASGRQGSCGQFGRLRSKAELMQILPTKVITTEVGSVGHEEDGTPAEAGQVQYVNSPWEGELVVYQHLCRSKSSA